MRPALRRAWAFLQRDARQQLSYRAAVLFNLAAISLAVVSNYFLGRFVDASGALPTYRDRGGYFAFSLTGTALLGFASVGLRSFSESIRQAQITGTLEMVFAAPVRSGEVVLWGSLWAFVYEAVHVAIYLAAGFALGVPLGHANWLSVGVVTLVSVLAVAPLGVFGAAFVLVFQKGDPIGYLVSSLSMLFAGVYYPVDVLPQSLRIGAELLPLTHALEGFRRALLQGATLGEVAGPVCKLCVFALVLGPCALLAFDRAVTWSRRNGVLARY